jgi:hypothetical protein
MPICRLCEQERRLVKAHIVPEAFYDLPDLRDGVTKILSNTLGYHPKKMRNGIYDENILCGRCDGELGKLDQHAAEQLLQIGPSRALGTYVNYYESADPEKLHAFIISVAWRASVSRHQFFKSTTLGEYEALLHTMLRTGDFSDERVQTLIGEFDTSHSAILNPHKTRSGDDRIRFWVIYANRFIFYVKTDKRRTPEEFGQYVLTKGRIVTSIVRSFTDSKEFPLLKKLATLNQGAFNKPPNAKQRQDRQK